MREDLVASAVSFLQDPTVAASPLEKRVAFLQSKNLTKEEIDASLLRAGENPANFAALIPASYVPPSTPALPPPMPPVGGMYNGGYFPGQMMQPRHDPSRDWRDYFILTTLTTTVGYGLYHLAKRYVTPLIAPPTPPQLETDKAALDAKFASAFALLDTLKTDTAALKTAEEDRKSRVDAALAEVESVVQSLKDAGKRREDESKRVGDEVRGLRDLIPKALEGQKESQKKALEDLQSELKSLKQLVMNRTNAGRPSFMPNGGNIATPPLDPGAAANSTLTTGTGTGAMSTTAGIPLGGNGMGTGQSLGTLGNGGNALMSLQRKDSPSGLPFGAGTSRAIPSWQLPAGPKPAATPATTNGETTSSTEGSSSG
ncbi:peroxisomal membrane protein pex14 [Rhizina undulata]